jgi:S1-C subfamily serine protease
MKVSIGALLFAITVAAPAVDAENQRRMQGPDSLILQGPGSDIRATVSVLPENRRPQGLTGVVIEQVTRDGPADTAGLRRGDIVTEFDAIAITDPGQFNKVIRDTPPGRRVKAIVWRDGVRREVFIAPVAGTLQ